MVGIEDCDFDFQKFSPPTAPNTREFREYPTL